MESIEEIPIIKLINNPEKFVKGFEKGLRAEGRFEDYKKDFDKRSMPYEIHKTKLLLHAGYVKKMIDELTPKIVETFKLYRIDFFTLRHEIDHADFFGSVLHQRTKELADKVNRLLFDWNEDEKQDTLEKYAMAKLEYLESLIESEPIAEVRALFFNYVLPGKWGAIDYAETKNKVRWRFMEGYVQRSLAESILDTLVTMGRATGEMDRHTADYLYHKAHSIAGNTSAAALYDVNQGKINFDVANSILYEELPSWQKELAAKAVIAADAIGNAYRDDPSRLARIKYAGSFDDAIAMCMTPLH